MFFWLRERKKFGGGAGEDGGVAGIVGGGAT
jgi:hypothetical protein